MGKEYFDCYIFSTPPCLPHFTISPFTNTPNKRDLFGNGSLNLKEIQPHTSEEIHRVMDVRQHHYVQPIFQGKPILLFCKNEGESE